MLKDLADSFSTLLKRKAFIYRYVDEGMDEMDFYNAYSNLQDLIKEYAEYSSHPLDSDSADGKYSPHRRAAGHHFHHRTRDSFERDRLERHRKAALLKANLDQGHSHDQQH